MADYARRATPEDIAEIQCMRQRCRDQFNIKSLAASMTKFYNLMITIGFWPISPLSVNYPPHINPPAVIDPNAARDLGFSASAIEVMCSIPYPAETVVYNQQLRIFELTRPLDLTDPEDLKDARHPPEDPWGEVLMEGHLITLMSGAPLEGLCVVLDCDIGAIYFYTSEGPKRDTLEYRVGRYVHNVSGDVEWFEQPGYNFAPFVPAAEWFEGLYQKYLTLRKLPFLNPRYEGDRDMDLDEVGPKGDWTREMYQRKQDVMIELFGKHGWPDLEAWDREAFLADWQVEHENFREEEREHGRQQEMRDEG